MTHVLFSVMSAISKCTHANQRSAWLLQKTAFQRCAASLFLIVCLKKQPALLYLTSNIYHGFLPRLCHLSLWYKTLCWLFLCDIYPSGEIGTDWNLICCSCYVCNSFDYKAHCVVTSFEITCLKWWQWKMGAARNADSSLASLAPRNHFFLYTAMISRLTTSKMQWQKV